MQQPMSAQVSGPHSGISQQGAVAQQEAETSVLDVAEVDVPRLTRARQKAMVNAFMCS